MVTVLSVAAAYEARDFCRVMVEGPEQGLTERLAQRIVDAIKTELG